MEDDNEQLDWGNEEDEQAGDYSRSQEYYEDEGGNGRAANADDTDDVVSLGGEEDDIQELVAFQSRSKQDANGESPGKVLSKAKGMPPPNSLRREGSDTSQPQQNSPSRSAARRSESSPRLKRSHSKRDVLVTHALPPKPVVAPAPPGPFRATAQMSLMEASTMANPMSTSSSDDLGPLPPDWEVRRPRNQDTAGQVYYFNIRTEVSQWTRPVDGGNAASPPSPRREKDSPRIHRRASVSHSLDGGRRSPSPHGSESNSFGEKRPRRSGSVDASSPDHALDVRADDHSQPYAHRQRLDTSYSAESVSESPKVFRGDRDRNLSRSEVNRDRPSRPRRESPPSPHWGDSQKAPHQAQTEGRWNNNDRRTSFGQNAELNGTQKPRHHRNEDSRVDTAPRGKGYDREGVPRSSTVRRDRPRSPPPHHREDNVASSGPGYSTATPSGHAAQAIPDYRSRNQGESKDFSNFDRQSNASWHHSTQSNKDVNVQQQSYEHPPRRPREPEPISRNSSENDAKRRRTDRDSDSAMARRPHSIEDNIPSPLLPVRDEPSPNTFHTAEEDEHRPPRRRQPLPPQSARFKEMASDLPPPPPPAGRRNSPVLPRGPRDSGTDRRTTNVNPNIPSGPRHSMPTRPSLDIKPTDAGYSRRPLDGSSSFGNRQDGRRQSDIGAAKGGRDAADRDVDDSMDIDTSPSSRYPPKARYGEATSARTNEGMYSDREDLDERDPLPRGPRAMSSRSQPPTPQNTIPPAQLSTSNFPTDTPPQGSKLPPVGPDQGWRGKGRDRSPPPHMSSKRSTRWGSARNLGAEHDDRDRDAAPESQNRRDNTSRTGTVDNTPANRPPPYSREHPYSEDTVTQPNPNRQSSVQTASDVPPYPSRNEQQQGRRQQNNWPARRDSGHPSSQQQVKGTGGNDIPIPPRRSWPTAELPEDLSLISGSAPHGRDQPPSSAARAGWGNKSFSGNGNGDMQGPERDVSTSTMGFRSDMMESPQNVEPRQRTQSFPGRRFNDRDHHEEPPSAREPAQEGNSVGAPTGLQRQSSFRAPSEPTQRVSRFSQPVKPVQQSSHQVSDGGGGEPRTWFPRENAPPDEDTGVNDNPRHAQRAHSPPPYSNESSSSLPGSHRSNDAERSRTVTGGLLRARSAERSPPRTELPIVHASLPPRPRFDSQMSADDHHASFRGRGGGPANRHNPHAAMRDPSPPPHAQFRDSNHRGRQRGGGRNSRFGSSREDWQKDAEARDNESGGLLNNYDAQQQSANNPVLKVHPSRMRMINSNSMPPPPPPQLPPPQLSQPSHLFSRNDDDPAGSRSSHPIRIRRPSTKFDTDFQAPELEPDVTFHGRGIGRGRGRDDRKGFDAPHRDPPSLAGLPPRQYDNRPLHNEEHSPQDRPVSSLLERLNMNPNSMANPSAAPPLRDRVASSWAAPEDGGSMGGDGVNLMRGFEENDGFGNHPYRGQRRRGKPRRGRGRGGGGNQFDA